MCSQPNPVSRPWRRFLRLQRAGVDRHCACGRHQITARIVRHARIQRDAVTAIKNAGGWVEYDSRVVAKESPGPGGKTSHTSVVR